MKKKHKNHSPISPKNQTELGLKKSILEFVRGKNYRPMGPVALITKLSIHEKLKKLSLDIIDDLLKKKILKYSKKQIILNIDEPDTIVGIIKMHPKGFGFVTPLKANKETQDIFIPKNLTEQSIDGDTVKIAINPDFNREKGPEGKVVKILKRAHANLAAIVTDCQDPDFYHLFSNLLGKQKPIIISKGSSPQLTTGSRILTKVIQWGDENSPCEASFLSEIGHIDNPLDDIKGALFDFPLFSDFSEEAIKEAKNFGEKVDLSHATARKDFSSLPTITIDPETAKDFDDALSIDKNSQGYHLIVHIADVAYYVKKDSQLDQEAYVRGNSTYFPGYCLPMLPHELSDELCSLKPNVIRFTVSVSMQFDTNGDLLSYQIDRSFIKSQARLSYEEAKQILDGTLESPHKVRLEQMVELALKLKQKRIDRGGIDLSLSETIITLDSLGDPTGFKTVEYDITHQLVEEFMLKANEIIATHLTHKKIDVLFRVHEAPMKETLEEFYLFARGLGFSIGKEPSMQDLQQLIYQSQTTPFQSYIVTHFIRSLKIAYYSSQNVGHFGLSLDHYCHFTSPIRRYSDLVIQRLLFEQPLKKSEIDKIGTHCSERERISFKAENSVKNLKKLRLLFKHFKEDPHICYEANVTKIKPFGVHLEIAPFMLESFVHISELEEDFFIYEPKTSVLRGKNKGILYKIGSTISLKIRHIDLIFQEVKWDLISNKKSK